jgi:hypothetical protein
MTTKRVPVVLVKPHPHAHKTGEIDIVDGMVTVTNPGGFGKADSILVHLREGGSCYARRDDIVFYELKNETYGFPGRLGRKDKQ